MLVLGGTSDFVCLCVFCVTLTPEDVPWRKVKTVQLFPWIPAHRRNTLLGGLLWLAGTLVLCTRRPLESSNPFQWRGCWKGSEGNQPWALWHCLQAWVMSCEYVCEHAFWVSIAFNRFLQVNLTWKKRMDKDLHANGSWLSPTRANLFVLFQVRHVTCYVGCPSCLCRQEKVLDDTTKLERSWWLIRGFVLLFSRYVLV